MDKRWAYYSVPYEGSEDICLFDFSPSPWRNGTGGKHLELRRIFPGSIIHCKPFEKNRDWFKQHHTGIPYHRGEGQ